MQMGTDFGKLTTGLNYAKALFHDLYTQAGKQQPQLLGSVFVPSKRLLAQMRFRYAPYLMLMQSSGLVDCLLAALYRWLQVT